VFASLEKALAIYGAGKTGASPVKDKAQLGQLVDVPLPLSTAIDLSQATSDA